VVVVEAVEADAGIEEIVVVVDVDEGDQAAVEIDGLAAVDLAENGSLAEKVVVEILSNAVLGVASLLDLAIDVANRYFKTAFLAVFCF